MKTGDKIWLTLEHLEGHITPELCTIEEVVEDGIYFVDKSPDKVFAKDILPTYNDALVLAIEENKAAKERAYKKASYIAAHIRKLESKLNENQTA